MTPGRPYVGRFAPSPTGRLHLGSMVAAVASHLDARAHGGTWLVRMEDLDPPREVQGAASDILRTLEAFGLEWDGEVLYQHTRHSAYSRVLEELKSRDMAFGCGCTRRELAATGGLKVYPGTCRHGVPAGKEARSWRLKTEDLGQLTWTDRFCGKQQFLYAELGDFVLRRADGYWAYHLAVVVDDEEQGVTDIVRGADLLDSTSYHVALQQALGFRTMAYAHVPVVTNEWGQKLSKQSHAVPVETSDASAVLSSVFEHLGLNGISLDSPHVMLHQATDAWRQGFVKGRDGR